MGGLWTRATMPPTRLFSVHVVALPCTIGLDSGVRGVLLRHGLPLGRPRRRPGRAPWQSSLRVSGAGAAILATAFAVSEDGFAALRKRERDYRWTEIEVEERGGETTTAQMCLGRPLDGVLWRDDILPCPPYLDLCLSAARSLGPDVHEDFLDTTFLADGCTTLRTWLADATGA